MSETRHDRVFNILHKVAEGIKTPATARYRLAACLVLKNEIISIGWNQKKTHPLAKKFGKNPDAHDLHAESAAIIKALSNHYHPNTIAKCKLYVLRLRCLTHRDLTLVRANAKPCKGCQAMIENFDIDKVYYTTDDGGYECE